MCKRSVGGTRTSRMDGGLSSPELQYRRRMYGPRSMAEATLHRSRVSLKTLKTLCVCLCFPTYPFIADGFRADALYTNFTTNSIFSPIAPSFIPEELYGQSYATFATHPDATPGLLPHQVGVSFRPSRLTTSLSKRI